MRVMVVGKATGATGNGAATDPEALEAMSRFNEELMSTSGHGGKVCVDSDSKVCTAGAGPAHTLLGAEEQSLCSQRRINGLAVATAGDGLTLTGKVCT